MTNFNYNTVVPNYSNGVYVPTNDNWLRTTPPTTVTPPIREDSFSAKADEGNLPAKNAASQKVTFGEGVGLFCKGFLNKAKNIVTSVVKHPIKTLATVALTVGALAALPLIGITSAVGASVLALGFAGLAIGKTVKHTADAVKHNKEGDFNKVREDIQKIGGDGLDLAMSLPFLPKAFKTVKSYVKFAPKTGFNSELIAGLKEAKGLGGKAIEFAKADLKIKYDIMGGEMGLKVKPQLVFDKSMSSGLGGAYDPTTGVMKINPDYLNPLYRMNVKAGAKMQGSKLSVNNLSPEGFLRHELEHFKQFSDIARSENLGVQTIQENLGKYHSERLPQLENALEQTKAQLEATQSQVVVGKLQEAQKQAILKELGKNADMMQNEIELSKNFIANPGKTMNSSFYEDIISQQGKISGEQAAKAGEYMQGFLDKLKDSEKINELVYRTQTGDLTMTQFNDEMLKVYEANVLETPAYAAQRQYIKDVLNMRPEIPLAALQAHSALDASV